MKRPIFPVIWLCLLWACLAQNIVLAQNGITVYSDTVSALEDVADDSTWSSPPSVYSHTFSLMDDLGNEGVFGLFYPDFSELAVCSLQYLP